MTHTFVNAGLVLLFILIGGFFAASEIALVSLRESQVRSIGQRGKRGERVARLAEDPNRFLSAVQIGVTFAGFLSAAFGATSFADDLRPKFVERGLSEGLADALSLLLVTIAISYFSLVLGELAPKRIALQRAEGTSIALAPVVDRIAVLFRPVIWLLSISTNAVVRLAGGDPTSRRDAISEEELRDLVAGHEMLSLEERQIVEDVFEAGDRQLREVMIPRTEVDFIEARTPVYKAATAAASSPHSRYPVVDGSHDNVVGFVHIRDLLAPDVVGRSVRVEDIARDVMFLPSTKRVLAALSEMRREGHHMAIVLDEYGGTFGIVTLEDLVEELVGDIRDEYDVEEPVREPLAKGAVDVDGLLNLDDFAEITGLALPDGPYETVAGYLMFALGRLPQVGDSVTLEGHTLTVSELDGRRIARVVVALTAERQALITSADSVDNTGSAAASQPAEEPKSVG
jgi:putative hemolysin